MLLHGWPGDRTDYREVVPLVSAAADVIVPDLRGFGESDKHEADPARQYNATAQARSVIGLIDELALGRPVIAGYDIGSRIAQAIARDRPDLVRALVIAPPLPGIGDRILAPQAQREFWYQAFHNTELSTQLVDGQPDAVRAYLRHFWSHWSGPGYEPAPATWITWCRSTGRQARSPPRSPGTGRARGRSPPPWRSGLPTRPTGSRYPLRCCGPNTIRCSPANGPTGSASSSPPPNWPGSTAPVTSRRSRLRASSPRLSSPRSGPARTDRLAYSKECGTVESLRAGKRVR